MVCKYVMSHVDLKKSLHDKTKYKEKKKLWRQKTGVLKSNSIIIKQLGKVSFVF